MLAEREKMLSRSKKNFEKGAIFLLIVIIRSLRRRKKTTDMTDSGYDTTAAGILIKKQNEEEMNTTIKTLIAMSKFKNLSKEQKGPGSEKTMKKATPREKVGLKQNIKEVLKTEEKVIMKYSNFSNLVDKRTRIRKEKAQIVTMKTIRAIQILPR